MSFPHAKTDGLLAIDVADELVIQGSDERAVARLDRVTGLVWRLADGKTSVDEIARTIGRRCDIAPNNEIVWAALDRLSDLDLMVERVTPPASVNSVSRRGAIRVAASVGIGAVAVGAAAITTSQPANAVLLEQAAKRIAEQIQKINGRKL